VKAAGDASWASNMPSSTLSTLVRAISATRGSLSADLSVISPKPTASTALELSTAVISNAFSSLADHFMVVMIFSCKPRRFLQSQPVNPLSELSENFLITKF
jgi:hypothetical protein